MPIAPAFLMLLLVLAASVPAGAQSADFGRSGPYLGGSLLGFYDDFDTEVFGLDLEADDTWGLSGRLGWRLNRWVAIEGLYEWFDETDLDLGPLDDVASTDAWVLMANLKLYPLAGRLQPYASLGAGIVNADLDTPGLLSLDDQAFTARFGGGIDAYATEHVVVSLEGAWYYGDGDAEDLSFFTAGVGLQYRF